MVFRLTDHHWGSNLLITEDLVRKPKGMKRILQERGLCQGGLKKQCGKAKKEEQETEQHCRARLEIDRCEKGKGCCALRLLKSEPDLLNEKSLPEIEINRYVVLFIILLQIMAHKLEITRLGHECLLPKVSLRT